MPSIPFHSIFILFLFVFYPYSILFLFCSSISCTSGFVPCHKTQPSTCSTPTLSSKGPTPLQGHKEGRKLVTDDKEKLSLQFSTPYMQILRALKVLSLQREQLSETQTSRGCPTPLHPSVQLIQVWHQLIFQDVVDHLLCVISILLQAGQDESLSKVWQQILHLGDQGVQLHTRHTGDGRGRSAGTLQTPNTTGGHWGGTELRAGSVHRNTGKAALWAVRV